MPLITGNYDNNDNTHEGIQTKNHLHGTIFTKKARSLVENTHSGDNHWLRLENRNNYEETHPKNWCVN